MELIVALVVLGTVTIAQIVCAVLFVRHAGKVNARHSEELIGLVNRFANDSHVVCQPWLDLKQQEVNAGFAVPRQPEPSYTPSPATTPDVTSIFNHDGGPV